MSLCQSIQVQLAALTLVLHIPSVNNNDYNDYNNNVFTHFPNMNFHSHFLSIDVLTSAMVSHFT